MTRVPEGVLTFAVPWRKFARMLANAEETFLTTGSWAKVRRRIARQTGATLVKLPIMPGGVAHTDTYIEMMDYIIQTLVGAQHK